ncbi:RMD1 family protein [Thiomicrorhabdus arctica]|jgi:uncharacterized Rmd1/YagE family protein|uniref:RMD1 family protein n=1 Tax=Thiomicrorhabdus arctica TaxID=131540 RepID=UPI0003679CE8|nr:RMD1 family protein [Thiomicrorhabdus arctica]
MTSKNELYALCYCDNFDFDALQKYLLGNLDGTAYRQVFNIEWQQGEVFIFEYGVVVFWGIEAIDRLSFLQKLMPYALEPLTHVIEDEFTFTTTADDFGIKNDHISLRNGEIMTRLAISHGLAQSIKLAKFEYHIQQTINDTAYIPKNIADTGSSKLSRTELAKLRGKLFIAQSNIMLNYDLLDIPDFFWEYPELSYLYERISEYLEIKQRIQVLSKKMETIHELFDMMAEEQKHKHSAILEWIVIWLIAFEVAATLFHDLLGII